MLRLILKDQGGKQHCLIPFVGSTLRVELFLKKKGISEKDALKERIDTPLYTLH